MNGLLERYLVNASNRISKLQWDVKVFSLTPQGFCHEIGLNLGLLCFRAKKLENQVSPRIVFLDHPAGTSVMFAYSRGFTMVVYEKIYFEAHTNDQYI